jgi:tetratricopeptide (TPR) repeat protein
MPHPFTEVTIAQSTMQALQGPHQALRGRFEYLIEAAGHFYGNQRVIPSPLIRSLDNGLYKMRVTRGLRIPFYFEEGQGGVALHFGDLGDHAAGELWHHVPPMWEAEDAVVFDLGHLEVEFTAPVEPREVAWVKRVWDPYWELRAAEHPDLELQLRLDAEQWAIAKAPGPVLLRGSAGCGKTTVAIYRLLANKNPSDRRLYLTYTNRLKAHAERLYDILCSEGNARPTFMTIDELCRAILGPDAAARFAPEAAITWSSFRARFFARVNQFVGRDPDHFWEEIQAFIKGDERLLVGEELHLTREEYAASPLCGAEDPTQVWRAFLDYKRIGGWDALDLAREAYRAKRRWQSKLGTFDEVIVDEAQDLTVFHLGLVLEMCRRDDGLFIAGDTQQAIHPSRFDWRSWRETLHRRRSVRLGEDAVRTLSTNYRSPRPVVDLTNAIAAWRRRVWDDRDPIVAEVLREGPRVRHVSVGELPPLPSAEKLSTRLMVICRDEEAKRQLQPRFGTALVFTVHEAKGLEGHVVVLWEPFGPDQRLWEWENTEDTRYRMLVNRLVVSVSRATDALFILDDYVPLHWAPMGQATLEAGAAAIEALRQELLPTWEDPDIIRSRAHELEEAERFEQAAGHYERLEAWVDMARCLARMARWNEAARLFERGDALEAAANAWRQAGRWREAGRVFGLLGRHAEAAESYAKANAWEEALPHFVEAEDWPRAAGCEEQRRRWHEAAEYFSRAERWGDAGRCLEAVKAWEEARVAYDRQGDDAAATRCLEALEDWAAAAMRHKRAGRLRDQGRCLLAFGDTEGACAAFTRAQAWKELGFLFERDGRRRDAREMFKRARTPFLAGLLAVAEADWDDAFEWFEEWALGSHLLELPRRGPERLPQLWDLAEAPLTPDTERAEAAFRHLAWDAAVAAHARRSDRGPMNVTNRLKKLQALSRDRALGAMAEVLEASFRSQWAARYFEAARNPEAAARCWLAVDHFDLAAAQLRLAGDTKEAERCDQLHALRDEGPLVLARHCEVQRDWARAARFFERAGHWGEAADLWGAIAAVWFDAQLKPYHARLARAVTPQEQKAELDAWVTLDKLDNRWRDMKRAAKALANAGKEDDAADCLDVYDRGRSTNVYGELRKVSDDKVMRRLRGVGVYGAVVAGGD